MKVFLQGFRAGLAKYLKDFEYKNATTVDLWSHFEKATGKPVSNVMSDWTQKKGYCNVVLSLRFRGCQSFWLQVSCAAGGCGI